MGTIKGCENSIDSICRLFSVRPSYFGIYPQLNMCDSIHN